MKVVNVSFFYDENINDEEELIEKHYTSTGWAEALQKKGIESIVITRFKRDNHIVKNGVQYFFYKDTLDPKFSGWQIPFNFLKKISALNADIIHHHNLTLSIQTLILRFYLNKKTAIIIQHHGGKSPHGMKRMLHNFFIGIADGFFFLTREQGDSWFLKKEYPKIMPVMEGSTYFDFNRRIEKSRTTFYNRDNAKRITGMQGSPVFLWVGRLDENKDPLTILNGFKSIVKIHTGATFYMIYNSNELENEVKEEIRNSEYLIGKVHLLGAVPHERLEMYYNSADYFVLGSHYEGSGYSLSEALRCGCIPIVTDIPSFRMMTNNGRLGALWTPGNKDSFIQAANKVIERSLPDEAKGCMDFFEKELSFEAIASTAIVYYQNLVDQRSKKITKSSATQYA